MSWLTQLIEDLGSLPRERLPWRAYYTQEEYNLPRVFKETCLEVRMGRSFLNFSQSTEHLVVTAKKTHHPYHPQKLLQKVYHREDELNLYNEDRYTTQGQVLIYRWYHYIFYVSSGNTWNRKLNWGPAPLRHTAHGWAPEFLNLSRPTPDAINLVFFMLTRKTLLCLETSDAFFKRFRNYS